MALGIGCALVRPRLLTISITHLAGRPNIALHSDGDSATLYPAGEDHIIFAQDMEAPMKMSPSELLDYLSSRYADSGFRPINHTHNNIPDNMLWHGGVEQRSFNRHRAVCVLELAGTNPHFDTVIEEVRKELHRFLEARFWRGLGIGLVVFSPELIEKDAVEKAVHSASKVMTTIIQWIVNVSPNSINATIGHTFGHTSTTPMVNALLDALGIPEMNRNIGITKPVSLLKTKLW